MAKSCGHGGAQDRVQRRGSASSWEWNLALGHGHGQDPGAAVTAL